MIELADLLKADTGQPARLIHIVDKASHDEWLADQPERARSALAAQGFRSKPFTHAILPGEQPDEWSVVAGVADRNTLSTWCLAKLAETLPEGAYRLADGANDNAALLGWLLAHYSFDRYRKKDDTPIGPRILLTHAIAQIEPALRLARATHLVRDLVNTPTADMGPAELEKAAEDLARNHDATLVVTQGDTLEQHYPMIHAVGRAAARSHAPRLIELSWGKADHPRIAIIGKGVCFDSGGLDLKPSSAMRLMKKDMGGAAHALALAQLIMEHRLPVRLHLLIPAVENAVSGNAFRPGDVLTSRNGLTVEIGNTDAEGRLVLADAITRSAEEKPELILDFATLTGAARVALGPDLPALFASDDTLARELGDGGMSVDDPIWRLPLWEGYDDMLKSDIADIANAGESGFAGAITAALFLKKFVPDGTAWAHFDTFAWRNAAKPGRPKGGDALGLRAAFVLLEARYPRP
ncbi:MAG: leucyl aminopeptidase family protein [Sphingobium sp.]|jgi:leucyl aminopeptidase|nr:leucyl aminopeptidase family protein [Sphingobium sp.]MCI1272552.1 leucyl aminopeptidase family protein [Sphingobium sp.]MCI1755089.1 leucyl aminopeptidase family protein [Sphingobium sp.]MCI2054329.1 leucyl aminopeptidase family protein [Sphingobium sp.]